MNYKRKANITLICVGAGFILCGGIKYYYNITLVNMLFYILEAALIGGMADWFAVTAIFREPLGFSFHTAIVPKNRVTIVNSIVEIVEKEFLSANLISERLEKINITDKIINWLDSKVGKEYLRKLLITLLDRNIEGEGAKRVANFINNIVAENCENLDLNKYFNDIFEWSLKSGEYKKILALVLNDIIKAAEGPQVRNRIFTIIDKMKAEKTQGIMGVFFNTALQETNLINIDEITDTIHMHLIETLYNLKNEENEETRHILTTIEEHLTLNAKNPFEKSELNKIKDFILRNLITEKTIKAVVIGISEELKKMESSGETEVLNIEENKGFYLVLEQVKLMLKDLKENNKIKEDLEKFIKKSIFNLINKEHNVIGKIVRDTLDSLSDDNLNKFIEDRAGNDLQWIRINGCIVGGMVGFLLFLFLNCIYDPIAVPFIRSLF